MKIVKPTNQIIGDGFIAWQWNVLDAAMIEAVLSIREGNETQLPPDSYVVSMRLPESPQEGNPVYVLPDDTANVLGSALMSAHRFRDCWKQYAGEYIYEILAQPVQEDTEKEEDSDGEV